MLQIRQDLIKWIREWFIENGGDDPIAVVGISGGVDSSVVAALCAEALGADRVYGILLPNANQYDINDSKDLVRHLGIQHEVINIVGMFNEMWNKVGMPSYPVSNMWNYKLAKGNTEARVRMAVLYGKSQIIGGRVSNNCNKSEQFIGYSTRWGDETGDFAPLRDLTKREVVELAHVLGLPAHLADKTPIDGLANNLEDDGTYGTDEDAMGFTYKELDDYILNGTSGSCCVDKKIETKHRNSEFKRQPIAQFYKKTAKDSISEEFEQLQWNLI